jgi:DNA mismatch endonuclease (patch repair protein)
MYAVLYIRLWLWMTGLRKLRSSMTPWSVPCNGRRALFSFGAATLPQVDRQCGLRKAGLRFQRNYKRLRGSPDIIFPKKKVAIFVDGDFWHGWRLPAWEHKLSESWRSKLRANRKQDQRNFRRLRAADWTVIRLWEHEIRSDRSRCIDRVLRAL